MNNGCSPGYRTTFFFRVFVLCHYTHSHHLNIIDTFLECQDFERAKTPQTHIHISFLSMWPFLSAVSATFQQAGCQSMSSDAGNYAEAPGNSSWSGLWRFGKEKWEKSDKNNWCMVESCRDRCHCSCILCNCWNLSTGWKLSPLLCVILQSALL